MRVNRKGEEVEEDCTPTPSHISFYIFIVGGDNSYSVFPSRLENLMEVRWNVNINNFMKCYLLAP
jgi:hypothetical protein